MVLDAGNFICEVNGGGQVPKFTYYLASNSIDKYFVQAGALYECEGNAEQCGKKTGNVALSSADWTFSTYRETNTSYELTMTSSLVTNRWSELSIVTYLEEGKPEVKFDVKITNYSWVSTNPNATLVFVFSQGPMQNSTTNDTSSGVPTSTYFRIVPTATTDSGMWNTECHAPLCLSLCTVERSTCLLSFASLLSLGEIAVSLYSSSGGKQYLTYEHFEGSLFHDPSFGIVEGDAAASAGTGVSASYWFPLFSVLLAIMFAQ